MNKRERVFRGIDFAILALVIKQIVEKNIFDKNTDLTNKQKQILQQKICDIFIENIDKKIPTFLLEIGENRLEHLRDWIKYELDELSILKTHRSKLYEKYSDIQTDLPTFLAPKSDLENEFVCTHKKLQALVDEEFILSISEESALAIHLRSQRNKELRELPDIILSKVAATVKQNELIMTMQNELNMKAEECSKWQEKAGQLEKISEDIKEARDFQENKNKTRYNLYLTSPQAAKAYCDKYSAHSFEAIEKYIHRKLKFTVIKGQKCYIIEDIAELLSRRADVQDAFKNKSKKEIIAELLALFRPLGKLKTDF